MYCKNCGSEIVDGTKFCTECGAPVEKTANVESGSAAPKNGVKPGMEPNCSGTFDNFAYKKKMPGGAARFFAVIVCIFLFFALLATSGICIARSLLSETAISNAIKSANIAEIDVRDLFGDADLDKYGLNVKPDGATLVDFVYDNIDQSKLSEPISREKFHEIASSEEFIDFISLSISKRAANLLLGVQTDNFDVEQIIDFIVDNRAKFEEMLGYKITDEQIEQLRAMLTDTYGEVIKDIDINKISANLDDSIYFNAVSKIFSNTTLIASVCICVILAAAVFAILRSAAHGLLFNGITFIAASIPFLALSFALSTDSYFVSAALSSINQAGLYSLVSGIIESVLHIARIESAAVAVLGVLMIVASIIVFSAKKSKREKMNALT